MQLGFCEGRTSSLKESCRRRHGEALLGESPGRREIPAQSFPGGGANKLGALAAFMLLPPGGPDSFFESKRDL